MTDSLIELWFRMREPQQAEHVRAYILHILARGIIFHDEIGC